LVVVVVVDFVRLRSAGWKGGRRKDRNAGDGGAAIFCVFV
jgi:hypothetical protein